MTSLLSRKTPLIANQGPKVFAECSAYLWVYLCLSSQLHDLKDRETQISKQQKQKSCKGGENIQCYAIGNISNILLNCQPNANERSNKSLHSLLQRTLRKNCSILFSKEITCDEHFFSFLLSPFLS